MAIIPTKPWVNLFGRLSIFRIFELFSTCFYSVERRFFALEYRKDIFLPILPNEKKVEKWPFLDQNHGLTPLEKCQFFDLMNFLFL